MSIVFPFRWRTAAILLLFGLACHAQTPAAAKPDPLSRDNPRLAVTGFLLACQNRDYQRASEYLDLRHFSPQNRTARGPQLARDLEAILNSAPNFNVLRLSRQPEGDLSDDADPTRESVVSITDKGRTFTLDLEHVSLQSGSSPVWIFSADTVAAIPQMTPSAAPPAIAHYLPPFLVQQTILETPLWKWLALLLAVLILISLGRLFDRLLRLALRIVGKRFGGDGSIPVGEAAVGPARLVLSLAVLRAVLQFIDPTAIARLYIGRALELILIWAIAHFLIKLVGLLLTHVEAVLNSRQQYGSRSMLHLARRAANVTIVVLGILLLLSNWGYNTNTLLAGLGVGGIAVALAAQQTIANVFGGVSVIGDQPVSIGDFGKFGDLTGTVEDIGMRSTRIRTVGRSLVSVPNSSFAGLNIENYSQRDKIPFDATLAIKRSTPAGQVQQLMEAIKQKLSGHPAVEAAQDMVRVTGLTSAALNLQVFCYLKTAQLDQFYILQGELFLLLNEILTSSGVELAS